MNKSTGFIRLWLIIGLWLTPLVLPFTALAETENSTDSNSLLFKPKDLDKLNAIISHIKNHHYKEVDDNLLFKRTANSLLTSLDPHSSYLDEEELKELTMETSGQFGGIGIEVTPEHGAIMVVTPLDDTPAQKAGVKPGDYIIQINNSIVKDLTLKDAINMMRGPKGSKVSLTILRKNENRPLVFNLRREMIQIKTVKHRMLEPGFAYIRIALFQELTVRDLDTAIKKIKKLTDVEENSKLKGLILDLRNNPGGLLDSAIGVADKFLDSQTLGENQLIVYTKGKLEEAQVTAKASPKELLPKVPIVVLINEGSASASEIVAGALQDHKRAIIVGNRSFGKGSVQTLIPIDKSSAIKLTTAVYYTPLGRSIQAKGIEPDINLEGIHLCKSDRALPRIDEAALLEHINSGNDNHGTTKDQDDKTPPAILKLAQDDYQLYEALLILKSQGIFNR